MSEVTDKEKRFDDYSQDENVERHVRKNRWVSIDLGGKPYVFLFANCFFFPLCLKIVDSRSTCCIITAYCFYYYYYYYYYSLCARESFCRQTRLNIRLKWKLNVHIIDCAQKESGLFVWVRLSRRRRQRIGDERDFFFFLKKNKEGRERNINI